MTGEKRIDLHTHTTCSDGIYPPEQLIEKAAFVGLSVISVTDHDTVACLDRAIEHGKRMGLEEVVPGVELSSEENKHEVHILGYYMDYHDPDFLRALRAFREERLNRARKMAKILQDLGLDVTFDEILMAAGSSMNIGRPHVAKVLLDKGYVSSTQEAFDKYIAEGRPAYVPKFKISPEEAVELILKAGGVPVYAHPGKTGDPDHVVYLVKYGLMGVEVWHPENSPEIQKVLIEIADRFGLIKTGGTDFHGEGRSKAPLGSIDVPYESYIELKRARSRAKI